LEINYQPRKAIKPQVLAKFHVDWVAQITSVPDLPYWNLYFDGSKQIEGSWADVVLKSSKDEKLNYAKLHI
jgi:hypothetical protein